MIAECSEQAWKRSRVWGWTVEECAERLAKHLHKSSLHNMPQDDALRMAEIAEYDEADWEHQEPPAKRAAKEPQPPPGPPTVGDIVRETLRNLPEVAAASSSSLLPVAPRPVATESIPVRASLLVQFRDSVSRAHTAARQAQRLCTGAANVFSDEAEILMEVKNELDKLLPK